MKLVDVVEVVVVEVDVVVVVVLVVDEVLVVDTVPMARIIEFDRGKSGDTTCRGCCGRCSRSH